MSPAKKAREGFSVCKSNNRPFRDPEVWDVPVNKKETVKRVSKNISQVPPQAMPNKSRTIQSGNAKRKNPVSQPQKKSFLDQMYPNGNAQDRNLIEMLEREVMDRSPKVAFDDIADLETAKGLLQEAVLLPLKMP